MPYRAVNNTGQYIDFRNFVELQVPRGEARYFNSLTEDQILALINRGFTVYDSEGYELAIAAKVAPQQVSPNPPEEEELDLQESDA